MATRHQSGRQVQPLRAWQLENKGCVHQSPDLSPGSPSGPLRPPHIRAGSSHLTPAGISRLPLTATLLDRAVCVGCLLPPPVAKWNGETEADSRPKWPSSLQPDSKPQALNPRTPPRAGRPAAWSRGLFRAALEQRLTEGRLCSLWSVLPEDWIFRGSGREGRERHRCERDSIGGLPPVPDRGQRLSPQARNRTGPGPELN